MRVNNSLTNTFLSCADGFFTSGCAAKLDNKVFRALSACTPGLVLLAGGAGGVRASAPAARDFFPFLLVAFPFFAVPFSFILVPETDAVS